MYVCTDETSRCINVCTQFPLVLKISAFSIKSLLLSLHFRILMLVWAENEKKWGMGNSGQWDVFICLFISAVFVCWLAIDEKKKLWRWVQCIGTWDVSEGNWINSTPSLGSTHISFSFAVCLLIHARANVCVPLISFLSRALIHDSNVCNYMHVLTWEWGFSILFKIYSVL